MKSLLAFNIGEQFLLKDGQPINSLGNYKSLGNFISGILPNIYVIAGILLLVLLIIGGVIFIIGAGNDSPDQAKKGKQAITAALIGFVVIFCSYWIMRIIGIITGLNIFSPTF